jgi:hypothetical protein
MRLSVLLRRNPTKAVELVPEEDDFATRLKLYQAGEPYRDEPGKK